MLISMLEVILRLDLHYLNPEQVSETLRDGSQPSHESRNYISTYKLEHRSVDVTSILVRAFQTLQLPNLSESLRRKPKFFLVVFLFKQSFRRVKSTYVRPNSKLQDLCPLGSTDAGYMDLPNTVALIGNALVPNLGRDLLVYYTTRATKYARIILQVRCTYAIHFRHFADEQHDTLHA